MATAANGTSSTAPAAALRTASPAVRTATATAGVGSGKSSITFGPDENRPLAVFIKWPVSYVYNCVKQIFAVFKLQKQMLMQPVDSVTYPITRLDKSQKSLYIVENRDPTAVELWVRRRSSTKTQGVEETTSFIPPVKDALYNPDMTYTYDETSDNGYVWNVQERAAKDAANNPKLDDRGEQLWIRERTYKGWLKTYVKTEQFVPQVYKSR